MRVHFRTENFGVVRNCHVEYRLIPTLYFSNEVHFQEFCGNEVHFQEFCGNEVHFQIFFRALARLYRRQHLFYNVAFQPESHGFL